jgi:hypothetical protein
MEDVGKKKVSPGDAAAGVVMSLAVGIASIFIFLEVSSRFDPNHPASIVYQQAQCRVWLPIFQSKIDALNARSDDVMREHNWTSYELVVADGRVSQLLLGDLKDPKVQSELAKTIAERDRLAAEVAELKELLLTLCRYADRLEHNYRRTKVEIAKLEARSFTP